MASFEPARVPGASDTPRPTAEEFGVGGTRACDPGGGGGGAHWGGGGWCAPDGGGRESGTPEKDWKCCWCGGCRAPHGWPGTLPQVGGGAPHPGACIGGRGGTPCGEPIIMAGGIPCAGIIRPSGMRYIIWYPGGGAPGGPSGAGGRIALRVRSNQCYFSALDESFRECRPVISRPRERKKKRNTRHSSPRVDASRWAIPSGRWHRARPRAITLATTKMRRCFGRAPARDRTPRCG